MKTSVTFNDEDYFEYVFGTKYYNEMKEAFFKAHELRSFEIGLFWTRGTYFWAFILGSFTAYFYVFNKILGNNELTIKTVLKFSPMSKIVLLLLSLVAFIFCLSWVLINKGSKYWQTNWEEHINIMEDIFNGSLYKTFLNTKTDKFDKCILSEKAYDYSVTQVTTLGSIMLMAISGCLSIFHFLVLILGCLIDSLRLDSFICNMIALIVGCFIFIMFIFLFWKLLNSEGNKTDNKSERKWRQRSS